MRFSTRSLASVILACLLLAVGLLACAGPTDRGAGSGAGSGTQDGGGAGSGPQDGGGAGSGPQDGGGDAAAVYQVVVQQDGMTLERFDLTELQDLPQVEIVTPQSRGAQIQNGPTVRDVLDAAGATGLTQVRIEGRDPAQTLAGAEVTDQVILDFTQRDTVKLAGAELDTDRWVRDVSTLVVNP